MTSVNPPEYYFPGIQYNSAFFSSSGNYVTLNYAQANYLGRQGTPTSIATTTDFTGDVQTNALTTNSLASLNVGATVDGGLNTDTFVCEGLSETNTLKVDTTSQFLGTITAVNETLTGNIRFNTNGTGNIYSDGTTQTSAYTGAGAIGGSFTNTNLTINNQGKITAISNGSGGGGGGTDAITADINSTDTTSTLYPILAGVGLSQTLYADNITTPLSYVPFTGTLSAGTFSGALTGNVTGNVSGSSGSCTGNSLSATSATTATNANNVYNAGLTSNQNYPIAYLGANTVGNQQISSDTGGNHLLFNPSLNILNISGNQTLSGSASVLSVNGTGTALSCPNASAISFPSANVSATTFTGALSGNATTASSCTGNSATATSATTAGTCTGNSATATSAGTCTGNSATATNISSGNAGDLLYQSGTSATAKLPIGTSSYVLTSTGSIPQWTAPGIATTPTLANVLLAGNSAGATNLNMNGRFITGCQELDVVDIVATNIIQGFNFISTDLAEFNSCVVDTTLTSTGNATFNSGVILGASAPLINSTSTTNPLVIQSGVGRGITLKTGGAAGISTTLGATGILTLVQPPVMSGASITSATIPIGAVVGTACDLSTVQNIGGDKTFINPPSLNGSLIVGNSIQLGSVSGTAVNINTPQTITAAKTFSSAITASAGVIGNASTASISTNIQGGSSGLIPYQTAVDSTLFTAVGTAGQVLKSNGGGAPTWTTNIVGNAATATTASSVSGGTVSATTGTFGTSLLSSGPLYIGSATQTLGTNSGAINFDGTTLTQLNITSNATNGDIKFFQNNGGASLNTLTIPATGVIQFPNSTNYVGSSVTGCSKVQSSASLTTGLTVQNTVGNTGDMVISQSSVTGTQQLILQTAATNTTGGIVISPKGTPALTIAPTGISTFTNSIVLQATAPTTNVSGYLGYIGTIMGNQPASLTSQTSNAIVSVSSASTTLQIGTYLLNFTGSWTAAVVGTFSAITVGLSTTAGTTYTAGTGAIYVYGYVATVGASNIYFNASKVFTVTAATAYYLCTQCAYTGTNNGQILGSNFVMTYTRIA